jgi:hypothetical protein
VQVSLLQSRVHRLTFERQDTKHTLMDTAEWLLANKAFESLYTESELCG